MVFVETPTFTRRVNKLLGMESYRLLQLEIARDPGKGSMIPRSRGLRKLRWESEGRGKRGGVRIIYIGLRGNR